MIAVTGFGAFDFTKLKGTRVDFFELLLDLHFSDILEVLGEADSCNSLEQLVSLVIPWLVKIFPI